MLNARRSRRPTGFRKGCTRRPAPTPIFAPWAMGHGRGEDLRQAAPSLVRAQPFSDQQPGALVQRRADGANGARRLAKPLRRQRSKGSCRIA